MTSGSLIDRMAAHGRRTLAAVRAQDDPRRAHELWRHGLGMTCSCRIRRARCRGRSAARGRGSVLALRSGLRFEVPLSRRSGSVMPVPTNDGIMPMDRIGCVGCQRAGRGHRRVGGGSTPAACCCRCATARGPVQHTAARYARDTARAPTGGRGRKPVVGHETSYYHRRAVRRRVCSARGPREKPSPRGHPRARA